MTTLLRGRDEANFEMVEGYRDGGDLDIPEPSANRTHSYRHSFAIRRAEVIRGGTGKSPDQLRAEGDEAIRKDDGA